MDAAGRFALRSRPPAARSHSLAVRWSLICAAMDTCVLKGPVLARVQQTDNEVCDIGRDDFLF